MSANPLSRNQAAGVAPELSRYRALTPRTLGRASSAGTSSGTSRALRRRDVPREVVRSLVVRNWTMMAAVYLSSLTMIGVKMLSLPPRGTVVMALLATAIVLATGWAKRIERKWLRSPGQRSVLLALLIGLPMALFGAALAHWTGSSSAYWKDAVGLLIIAGALAAIILNRRIPSIIFAQVALWSGVFMTAETDSSLYALIVGGVVGVYTSVRQARADAALLERDRERVRAQLRAEEILEDYERTGQGWFWETDRRGLLVYLSPTIGELLGRDLDSLLGRPLTGLFVADPAGQESERTLAFHLTARSAFTDLALRAATRSEERWWSVSGRPVYDKFGNFVGFRGSGADLTEKKRSEEHASRLAHYDSLTGLANRFQMSQTLEKILNSPNVAHRICAVFLIDLDRFKQVNDTMGHPAGDNLLKQVATRLERSVGGEGRVGRLGGDEFQVILVGQHRREHLADLAQTIICELSEPYSIDGLRVVIGASLGIALAPDDGVTSEALIRNADLALYAAKDAGRGRHHFYAPDLHSDAEERRQLEQDLRDALSNGGLELYYQPVIQTATEQITGFEALMRWNHPERGYLSPARFIPIAEDSGLITQMGEWALRTACHDLAGWPQSVRVAVNVSPLQFASPSLPAVITSALAAAQIDPRRLELEITESVFLNDDEGTDAMFAALKNLGVRLALDDFGTGYSSLGYLKKAPFDKIKIDQSFVRGATIPGNRNAAIIGSIVSLAEALGMETTAEGVETLDELDLMRTLGCSHVQGFIYERPLSRDQATLRLQSGLAAIAKGPRAARAVRHKLLRRVMLDHAGQRYHGTIRNVSKSGVMIEGLWHVPPGTRFRIVLGEGNEIEATARWCQDDRMGLEFASPLALDEHGLIAGADHRAGSLSGQGLAMNENAAAMA